MLCAPQVSCSGGRLGHESVMHAATRRPAASWPSALLPGALLVALLTTGAVSATSGGSQAAEPPVTELQVVDASR